MIRTFHRRTLAALAAGASLLALGDAALAQGKYKEAPALAEQVKAGKLPAVDARLPETPLVVPTVEKVGEYGGTWRRAFLGPADANNYVRVVYDALFRFSPDGAKIEPKVAESATPSDDFKTWTIKLRKGSKWSDGQPFGADDILFWYNDVLLNKELTPSLPGWIRNADGTPAKVEKVDDNTVRFTYAAPATLFLTAVANQDGADRTFAMFLPGHYLKKFHPAHTPKADIDKAAQAAGFKTWTELFANRNAPPENPERPTMAAWVPSSRASDPVFTLKRNPYYVGVDSAGNQLPYLDEVRFTYFADAQALNLAAIAGNFDMQERHINMTNYPVLKDQEKTGKYRVIAWPTFGGADAVIAINSTYTADPEMGKVMAEKDFRRALSLAINRDQIKESVFLGLGEARQGVPAPWHPYFPGRRMGAEVHRVQPRPGQQDARRHRPQQEGRQRHPATAERQARDHRDQRRAGVRRLAGRGAAGLQGLGGGRHQDHRAGPRAGAALQDEREQRADGRGVERGHQRLPLHRQRQGRPAQRADPDHRAAVAALVRDRRQGRHGAAAGGEAHRRDRRQGAHRRARGAGETLPGALSHLGREPLRDRHGRA